MVKTTCIYGFDWDGEVIAEYDNTIAVKDRETNTCHIIRKDKLDKPNRRGSAHGYKPEEAYSKFDNKGELFVYLKKMK